MQILTTVDLGSGALQEKLLALVGDAADCYPGILGIGAKTAPVLLNRHGPIEEFPPNILGQQRDLALLFKKLATLRADAPLFKSAKELRWRGGDAGLRGLGGADGGAAVARAM
ncbi:MAG: 5'-3' exonuclease H3TH domain-containing protein [Chthoniobacterales bacterium]